MRAEHELKRMQTRRRQIISSLKEIRATQGDLQKKQNKLTEELEELNIKIGAQGNEEPVISEHAILRYMERVLNMDIERIKAMIVDSNTAALIKNLKTAKIPVGDGIRLVVKDNVVVSVNCDKGKL